MDEQIKTQAEVTTSKENAKVAVDLETAINRLDILVYALFKLLKEKGVTEDELTDTIDGIIKERNSDVYEYNAVMCSNCNKPLQESKQIPMLGKCLYCGEQHVLYPYPKEAPVAEVSETDSASEKKILEPYDLLKELRFDEE